MPPKSSVSPPRPAARTKSPVKASSKPGVKAAPAGSAAVAKAAGAANKANTAPAPTSAVATRATVASPSKPAFEQHVALLNRVVRAFESRLSLGAAHKRRLKALLTAKAEERSAAYAAFERDKQAKDRKAEATAKQKAEARQKLQTDLCAAAFDGDIKGIRSLLANGGSVHRVDADGNFALGEAAVNGQSEALQVLIDAGADPNSKGAFGRTPLWRACFNSHSEAAMVLLRNGADPRIACQGQLPAELASGDAKKAVLAWDASKTDAMVKAFVTRRAAAEASDRKARDEESAVQQSKVTSAKEKFQTAQQAARAARAALEHRISEYDLCELEGKGDKAKATLLGVIKQAEEAADAAEIALSKASDAYLDARREASAALTEQEMNRTSDSLDDDTTMTVGRLEVGNLLTPGWAAKAASRRSVPAGAAAPVAPLLIDVTGSTSTFFRYRNVNFVDTFSSRDLAPDQLRKALLGALRFGKALVVDLRDVPMLEFVVEACDAVRKGLWGDIVSGKIKEEGLYLPLVKATDGAEYEKDRWRAATTANFTLLVLTSGFFVDVELASSFLVFKVDFDS